MANANYNRPARQVIHRKYYGERLRKRGPSPVGQKIEYNNDELYLRPFTAARRTGKEIVFRASPFSFSFFFFTSASVALDKLRRIGLEGLLCLFTESSFRFFLVAVLTSQDVHDIRVNAFW